MQVRRAGVYYGWVILAIAMVIYMLIVGATYYAFGLFVLPVSAELRLSRAEVNNGFILFNIGVAALAPFVGRAVDRLPIRLAMVTGAALMGVGFAALAAGKTLWVSAVVLTLVLPAGYLAAGTLTAPLLVARWFAAQRGRAMSLLAAGYSLGALALSPLIALAIEAAGWRAALGMMAVGVAGPVLLLSVFVRSWPSAVDIEPAPRDRGVRPPPVAATASAPIGMAALLARPQFWLIGVGASLLMAVGQGVLVSLVPLAGQLGVPSAQAATLVSVTGGATVAGAMLMSALAERFERVTLLVALAVLGALLNGLLLEAHSYAVLAACAAMLGIAAGAVAPLTFAVLADLFGAASFGAARGLTLLLTCLGGVAAVRFVGEVYDRLHAYGAAFLIFVAVQCVAALLLFAARLTRSSAAPDASV
jgi:MFS family permease